MTGKNKEVYIECLFFGNGVAKIIKLFQIKKVFRLWTANFVNFESDFVNFETRATNFVNFESRIVNFETVFYDFESRIVNFESRRYKKLRMESSLEV